MGVCSDSCFQGRFSGSLGVSKLKSHMVGDPHFIGFDDTKFDLHGQPDKYYNLISDDYIQVNAYFKGWNGTQETNMGEIGIKIGKKPNYTQIYMNRDGEAKINGEVLTQRIYFPLGFDDFQGYAEFSREFEGFDQSLPGIQYAGSFEGAKIYVNAGKYTFVIVRCSEPVSDQSYNRYFLNLISEIRSPNVRPHGIIGQTHNKDKKRIPQGKQGEGVIEGVYTDYEVSSLWDCNFKYNRFSRNVRVF
jgi:hypothetical protein